MNVEDSMSPDMIVDVHFDALPCVLPQITRPTIPYQAARLTMKPPFFAATVVATLMACTLARGQVAPSTAKIDAQPLELTNPDRYRIPSILEPVRRVTLIATTDSILRNQEVKAGALARDGQVVAQLDRTEAVAKLKLAQASVKEEQAILDGLKGDASQSVLAGARLEAAKARLELAQLELDRTTIRAPFSGKIVSSPLSDGQFVTKGTVIAELADVSSLKLLIPINRAAAALGSVVTLNHDGESLMGKIHALVPLSESFSLLHELRTPYTGAWLMIANPDGKLEPGERLHAPDLPENLLATIPEQALQKSPDNKEPTTIQVLRNEYVATVKVKRLGGVLAGTVQITGSLRPNDLLIVSSSVPLAPGTLVRFNPSSMPIEGTNPNPNVAGVLAEVTPPRFGGRVAPIGPPGSALPKAATSKKAEVRPTANPRPRDERPASRASGGQDSPF